MKSFQFFLYLLGVGSSLHAVEVPYDGRVARAEFVSSLIKPGDIGAEIGVNLGVFAFHVLLQQTPSKLYLIDPWKYGLQKDMELAPTPEKQLYRDKEYAFVCNLFAPYPNVSVIREKSEDIASSFPDQFFDYVYIDGEHSYDAVKRDLNNYFPKIKVGGYLIGDDYGWTGIADAVQEFLNAHQDEILWGGNPYEGKTGGQFSIRRIK